MYFKSEILQIGWNIHSRYGQKEKGLKKKSLTFFLKR